MIEMTKTKILPYGGATPAGALGEDAGGREEVTV
ncbi:MAG: hypothetical protein ACI9QA_000595 [Methanobacteriota archaeon]|jgi:hypothetical protein